MRELATSSAPTTAERIGHNTYLNRYSLPWNKNARSMPQVCEFRASSILSTSSHADTANCAFSASESEVLLRMRMQLCHKSIVRMYNAHTVSLLAGRDDRGANDSPGNNSAYYTDVRSARERGPG